MTPRRPDPTVTAWEWRRLVGGVILHAFDARIAPAIDRRARYGTTTDDEWDRLNRSRSACDAFAAERADGAGIAPRRHCRYCTRAIASAHIPGKEVTP